MTAHLLAALCAEAGLPPGVLNIVHGLGAEGGRAAVRAPATSAPSPSPASTRTGGEIARAAAPRVQEALAGDGREEPRRSSSPTPISTRRLPHAVALALLQPGPDLPLRLAHLRGAVASTREFATRSSSARARCGSATRSMPTPTRARWSRGSTCDKVLGYIALAREEGGRILCGGGRAAVPGPLRGRLLRRADADRRAWRRRAAPTRRRSSARSPRCSRSTARRRRSQLRQRDALRPRRPRSGRATCRGRTASPRSCTAASSG